METSKANKTVSISELVTDPSFVEAVFTSLENDLQWGSMPVNASAVRAIADEAKAQLLRYSQGDNVCQLIKQSVLLYKTMKLQLGAHEKKHLSPVAMAESGFHIANDSATELAQLASQHDFENPQHEIQFFKVIRPLFGGEVEYYSLLYHAALFCEDTGSQQQLSFWQREQRRKDKFMQQHRDFFDQYLQGSPKLDDCFKRKDKSAPNGNELLSKWIGLHKYELYVAMRLAESKSRQQNLKWRQRITAYY